MNDLTVWDGWCRYWMTFARPLPVVVGFTLACILSDLLFGVVKSLVLTIVEHYK